jgi:hypothetical protein
VEGYDGDLVDGSTITIHAEAPSCEGEDRRAAARRCHLSEADLLSLYLAVMQDIDTQFQFWLSITFAVLVASFVADERLNRLERVVIAIFYGAAATVLLLRYQSALRMAVEVRLMFDDGGLQPPEIAPAATAIRLLLFTLGSLIAAASVIFGARRRGSVPVRLE